MAEYSNWLRNTFIIHIVIGFIFGLSFFFIPDLFSSFIGWEPEIFDPINRVFGAAIIGLTSGSILALLDPDWEKVKILVRIELVWLPLGVIAMIFGMFTSDYPVFGWVNVLALAFLFVLFSVGYYKEISQK
ncbi:unnamed protein product [marine sediment metagenome]|uniref:SPW repeat-containing protein n=1 Tax=marine sediment metagenome TaxID=412755 RepID=X1H3K8_9ZZZZ